MPYRRPAQGCWLRPSEAADVAERWASNSARDYALSERLGRELLAWLGLVAAALCFIGCAPETPCTVRPQPGVEAAWCPGAAPSIGVDGCPVEVVRNAAGLWVPLLDDAAISTDTSADIEIQLGDVPGPAHRPHGLVAHRPCAHPRRDRGEGVQRPAHRAAVGRSRGQCPAP